MNTKTAKSICGSDSKLSHILRHLVKVEVHYVMLDNGDVEAKFMFHLGQ